MMDWFPAVMTLAGVLVGVGVQEFRIWREKKDKYKDMVFEKRLDAHQGAYYWCMTLVKLAMPHRLVKDGGKQALVKGMWEATEWLNKNALYLDEGSLEEMNKFFQYVSETGVKYRGERRGQDINVATEAAELVRNSGEVLGSIKRGIGYKYLPETRISSGDIEADELFDKAVEKMEELIRKEKK
jgi:hypothetical protein